MIVKGGVAANTLQGTHQVNLRLLDAVQFEIDPTQAIQIGAVIGIQGHRLLDQVQRLVQVDAHVGPHVSEVVQGGCMLWIQGDHLPESLGRLVVFLPALLQGPQQEVKGLFMLEVLPGFMKLLFGFLESLLPLVDLQNVVVDLQVFLVALDHPLQFPQCLPGFSTFGQHVGAKRADGSSRGLLPGGRADSQGSGNLPGRSMESNQQDPGPVSVFRTQNSQIFLLMAQIGFPELLQLLEVAGGLLEFSQLLSSQAEMGQRDGAVAHRAETVARIA